MNTVVIGTPLKGSPTLQYMNGLVSVLSYPVLGTRHIPVVVTGTYVNYARNDLVEAAMRHDADDLLMIDSDMEFTRTDVHRIESHHVDIVAGIYCKRSPGQAEPLYVPMLGAVPDKNGLLEVDAIATGFMRVRMNVFTELYRVYPQFRFRNPDGPTRLNYFPIQVWPSAVEGEPGSLVGEDFGFCRLARQAGFRIYADTEINLRHVGEIRYPAAELPFS